LNYRDQIILDCLISTGLDDGDFLKLDVGFVRAQPQPRLFLNSNRSKTLEVIRVFFSLTASKKLRNYVKRERKNAQDSDPLIITTLAERKKQFRNKFNRPFTNEDLDSLPEGNRLTPGVLATNFRKAAESMDIYISKGQQSPLRPKRLRKVFESACTHAGLDPNIRDIFMGHKGSQSKTYEGKSREELEFYYELVEPKINIQVEETNETEDLREELHKQKKELSNKIKALEKEREQRALIVSREQDRQLEYIKQELELLKSKGYTIVE